ncbi:MAG: Transcriptional regulator [Actinomycetota bacterium]|nr:Transcriptional regulator [Actinomycetota bacterium]
MVTMGQWTGRETRLLRHALRLTVRDFAEDLGVSPRTVSKWETAGSGRTPRPELQAALDTLLARATDEDRERFEQARVEAAAPTPENDEPLHPGQGHARPDHPPLPLGLVSGLPHMNVDQLRQVSQLVDDARGQHEGDLVPYFAARIEDCQTQDGSLGPIRTLPSTLSVIAALDVTARQVSLLIRRQLLTLAARSAEFTGWLYRDAGALDQATYWYDRATEWAQEAHNPAMQGYVLLRKSQMAYDHHDGIRVLTLAEAAEFGPWQLPACVRAEVAQQQALGLGMLGSPRDDVERKLDRAWSLLGQAKPADDDSHLLGAVLTEGTLRLRSGVCYTEAGQTERATDLFGQVLAGDTLSRRDAGYFTARRAAAFALGGDPDTAATLALQSVEVATSANSQRTLRVVSDVVTTLQPWSDRPAVRSLSEAVAQ